MVEAAIDGLVLVVRLQQTLLKDVDREVRVPVFVGACSFVLWWCGRREVAFGELVRERVKGGFGEFVAQVGEGEGGWDGSEGAGEWEAWFSGKS